ncbi:MAG: FAD-dependent monooxygenase [Candidatus Bathyarchaeota archaeon]
MYYDVVVIGAGPAGATSAFRCSKLGFKVLLIEKGDKQRCKPCGGLLTPVCSDYFREVFEADFPDEVFSNPKLLGIYLVPPSGRRNAGKIRKYNLTNIRRDKFDFWMSTIVEKQRVEIQYRTELVDFKNLDDKILVEIRNGEKVQRLYTRYLIGADGVHSRVRNILYKGVKFDTITVLQEYYKARGDFENSFHCFFQGEISPTYAYVIPKDGLYLVGLGVKERSSSSIADHVRKFKAWLKREFSFEEISFVRKEVWKIPFCYPLLGEGNVILAGDAGGFCNALTGEGIRYAIESGVEVGLAFKELGKSNMPLASIYSKRAEWISTFIRRTHDFAAKMTDEEREKYVQMDLARIPFV